MTLYFDYRVNVGEYNAVFNCFDWHKQFPLLAVATYIQDRGGAVHICDELGERLPEIDAGSHPVAQVTCLAWHPGRKTLIVTWQNGDIRVWNDWDNDFSLVPSTRQAPVTTARWSTQGTRLITIDSSGEIGGWRLDARGQLLNLFWTRLDSGQPVCLEPRKSTPILTGAPTNHPTTPGDELVRDVFSSWRPRTAGRRTNVQSDNVAFFIASDKGSVFLLTEGGNMEELVTSLGKIQRLLYHDKEDFLLVVSEGFNMGYYSVDPDSTLHEVTKVKLSGSGGEGVVSWAGGLVACAVGDTTIRLWAPATGDTHSVRIHHDGDHHVPRELITSLVYSPYKGLLAGCTNGGSVGFWRRGASGWYQVAVSRLKQPASLAAWGPDCLAVITSSSLFVLREHNLSASYQPQVSVVQTSASQLTITSGEESTELKTDLQVSGLALGKDSLVLWSGKVLAVYQILPVSAVNVISSWSCECVAGGIWEQSVAVLTTSGVVQVLTLQGTVKQQIETDGQACTLHLNGPYLTVSNVNGMLQLWDLSRREAKAVSKVKDLVDCLDDFGEVMLAVCNHDASCVAITIADSNLTPVPAVFVWQLDEDLLHAHYFNDEELRFVVGMSWDVEEARLLVCEAKRPVVTHQADPRSTQPETPPSIVSSFIVSSGGLLAHDSLLMGEDFLSFLAFHSPYFIVLEKSPLKQRIELKKIVMKEFEGLEDSDAATKNAIINFSISLLMNDIDKAFHAIRNIKSGGVWTGLARMCVKSGRLDVARVCLGRMGDTRGVAALLAAEAEPEQEARLAALALLLNMNEEAERLYKKCKRFDLLNKMYQRSDRWEEAMALSEKSDRIHLRNTYHNYAKHLEGDGRLDAAIEMYYKAETHRQEVPRMLLNDLEALEKYITTSKDPSMLKWWAQYLESTGDMEGGLKHYKQAGDHVSLVRVLCFLEQYDNAALIAEESGDKAACYHLARALESVGRLSEAIHFFSRATAYSNAIRMCKEQGMDEEVWTLALTAGPREQAEVARYLESTAPERAVLLYHRANLLHRALDLAFKNNLYDAIEIIGSELTGESDRELLVKCASYFTEQQHFEKAVHLLAIAKQFEEGIALCLERGVIVTEELAEALSPDSSHPDHVRLTETLGDWALSQANYHLATKKYTQAGNKMKAMKALLKSGDTEKIIFFANVSRQKEMYIMAANYLQSLDWQARPELLKTIITFYNKGKAPHLLANFYMACAQVEVDDYGNYEKALGALNEALRCLGKGQQTASVSEAVTRKIALVNKFLDIKRMFEKGETEGGMRACRQLVSSAGELVRRGDVYALMVEAAARQGDLTQARSLASELKQAQPADSLSFYLHQDLLGKLGLQESAPVREHDSIDYEEEIVEDETVGTSF